MAKKKSKNQWVVPMGDQWGVRGEGNSKLTRKTDTQREAVEIATNLTRLRGAEFVVLDRQDRIRSKVTYDNDPNPPKSLELPSDLPRNYDFDVFISHATEDKDEVVRPLVEALRKHGLSVWYDEFELKIGDSLRRKIDHGLATSRFGIIVLSRHFITKGWTNYELDGLIARAVSSGRPMLLPIWHNISKREVIDFSPSLADTLARDTSICTVEEIAEEIANVIKSTFG